MTYQRWNDGVEILQMKILLATKFIGENIDENFEVLRSFREVLHQISDHIVQVSNDNRGMFSPTAGRTVTSMH